VQDILWKVYSYSPCQTIACFLYESRRFIIVLTKARHRTLSWASRIHLAPSITIPLRSILMLSPTYEEVFPVVSSFLASQPKPCKHPSSSMHATCPTYRIFLDLITLTILGEGYRPWNSLLYNFYPRSVFLPFRSKYPQHCSQKSTASLKVTDQVSHPYRRSNDRSSIPSGAGNFSLRHHVQTDPGAHPTSYPKVTGDLPLGVKRPGREGDHSTPSSAEVKECVELYFHSPIRLHGTVLS
jgi:hypothetical protein